mmetsp:Transcript_4288/g.6485  ORF Transcript_4288/g.6485 Transcript_4288/m.6485 type:complete len:280 (+) Transcript_4288:13-852(+)
MDANNFKAGATATILTSTFMQPFDVIKTFYLFQHNIDTISGCVQHVHKTFGLRGFWKGYSASFLRSIIGGGFTFFWYEYIRNYLGKQQGSMQQFFTDSLATLVGRTLAITVQCPLSVVKVKMENPAFGSSTLRKLVNMIYRKEGLKGFYIGLVPNLLRDVPYTALAVPFYEQYARILSEMSGKDRHTTHWVNFLAGGMGGLTACVLTQPFDVMKTRAMSGYKFGGSGYPGMAKGLQYIYKNEGLKGFRKGLSIRISERSLGQAFIWMFYIKAKAVFNSE